MKCEFYAKVQTFSIQCSKKRSSRTTSCKPNSTVVLAGISNQFNKFKKRFMIRFTSIFILTFKRQEE